MNTARFPIVLGEDEHGPASICTLILCPTQGEEYDHFGKDSVLEVKAACDMAQVPYDGFRVEGFKGKIDGQSLGVAAYVAARGISLPNTVYTGTIDPPHRRWGDIGPIGGLGSKARTVITDHHLTLVAPKSHFHETWAMEAGLKPAQVVHVRGDNYPFNRKEVLLLVDSVNDLPLSAKK